MRRGKKLRWGLVENAIDFVRVAVESYFYQPPARPGDFESSERPLVENHAPSNEGAYKYAILHLHAGILLLLKARLKKENTALIFKNLEKPERDGRLITVDFDQAVLRIRRYVDAEAISHSDLKTLRRLQTLRNEIEHYEVDLEPRQAASVINDNVQFIYRFLADQLAISLPEKISPGA